VGDNLDQDTGEGIRAADLQKIFIPFFTTKSGGHGVGLALAHRVISEHGGMLSVENAPAGGALSQFACRCEMFWALGTRAEPGSSPPELSADGPLIISFRRRAK